MSIAIDNHLLSIVLDMDAKIGDCRSAKIAGLAPKPACFSDFSAEIAGFLAPIEWTDRPEFAGLDPKRLGPPAPKHRLDMIVVANVLKRRAFRHRSTQAAVFGSSVDAAYATKGRP